MRVIAGKLLKLVAVVFVVSLLTFVMTRNLGGDPVVQKLGPQASDPVSYAATQHELGLDRPFVTQYADWLWNALHGDLGRSYNNNQEVSKSLQQRLPVTLELLFLAQLFSILIAVPLGIYCAYRQNSRIDRIITGASFGILSIPGFALAIILVYFFAVQWNLVPATGYTRLTEDVGENLRSVALAATILTLPLAAVYTRLLRSDMIANLHEDFILVAKSKGLPTWHILLRHALRPSSFSLLTVFGINFGTLLGGSVIVEYLFALPGVGSLAVESIGRRDYLVTQGVVLLIAIAFVLANFIVDILYSVLDPRIRRAAG
jgi:peptide/nickel transport system permease protein